MNATERVVVAFRMLLDGQVLTPSALSEATGSAVGMCSASIAVLGSHVPLVQVGHGAHIAWVLAGREVKSREQRAAELHQAGALWTEVALELGYASGSGARKAAHRWAARRSLHHSTKAT